MAKKEILRSKQSAKNAFFSLIKYVLSIVTSFSLRTLAITYFGQGFLGLSSLCSNILSVLSISELGIGTSLIYKLYKPMADDDKPKIKKLLLLYKKIYWIIGSIILAMGLVILPFLGYLTAGEVLQDINIYWVFVLFLVNSVVSYLNAHRRALIFANQKNYVEMISSTISMAVIFPLQIILIVLFKNIYFYVACNLLITLLDLVILNIVSKRQYKEIMLSANGEISKEDKTEIKKNTFALALTKISTVVFKGMDSIIISAILGVTVLGFYSNYYSIVTYVFAVMVLIFGAVKASVGNYIAGHNKEDVYKLFKTINLAFAWMITFCTVCLVTLFQPFMSVWGSLAKVDMMLSISVPFSLALYFYIDTNRECVRIFKETAGMFWKDRYCPLISAVFNLVLSVIMGKLIGIVGVILASVISIIVLPQWVEIKILYRDLFELPIIKYWTRYVINMIVMLVSCAITYLISIIIPLEGILLLIADIVLCLFIPNLICFLVYCRTNEFKALKQYIKNIVKGKQTKK